MPMLSWTLFFPNERVFFTFIMEVIVTIALASLSRNLYHRYKERQQPAAKYITLTTVSLSFTTCLQLLDLFILDPFAGTQRIGLGLAFAASAMANIFLYLFMLEIFSTGRGAGGSKLKIYIVVEVIVAISLPITGPLLYLGYVLFLLVHLVCSFVLYAALIRVTTVAINKTEDTASKTGFKILRVMGISIIATYILFIMDAIWSLLVTNGEGYTYWVLFAWAAAGLSGILLYLGFTLPIRIRARLAQPQAM